ncbi:MAG: hypothetical protein ACXW2G_04675 [Burkholderiaceae bacterium]
MDDNDVRNPGASGTAFGDNPQAHGGAARPAGRMGDPGARGREALDDAKQKIGSLGQEAKEQGKEALSRRKEGAAEQFGSVAAALHTTADDLQGRNQPQAGRFVSYAAEQLESFGRRIRDKDVDSIIDEASQMGRRSPAVFFAGSVVVGFLVSRFLKSSQAARERESRDSTPVSTPPSSRGAATDWDDGVNVGSTASSSAYGMPASPATSREATRMTTRDSAIETDGGRFE